MTEEMIIFDPMAYAYGAAVIASNDWQMKKEFPELFKFLENWIANCSNTISLDELEELAEEDKEDE